VPKSYKETKIKEEDKLHVHDGLEMQIENEILSGLEKDDKNIFDEISHYTDEFENCCNKREPNKDIQNAYNELLKFMKEEKIQSFFKKIKLTNYLSYLKIRDFQKNDNEIKKDENIQEKNQDNFNMIHKSSVNDTSHEQSYSKIENFKENNGIKKDKNIQEKNQDNFNMIHKSSVNDTSHEQSYSKIGRKLLSESVNKQYYHLSWFKKLLKLFHILK